MVVIKSPIIAENRNQTIPKEIPVMKFRHGAKFGNSAYVWSSIMSAAAQLVIQEVILSFHTFKNNSFDLSPFGVFQ